ncbi:hypothetical protein LTR48_003218 [Friedmanniomyces endolithicus]|uniref:Uncharacterized protein n=1 Tax=Rachicladosporium monterosium TaxID=1507873 RepID=A0ABR0L918_9PEZI|nr:hypothetical protein LTS09_016837 [Friedmanniomyces endolithicus]KAK0935133.1 hypothetical protein LTR29_013300 [Friedmanniomyces endolithicus]KAK1086782.1 hypothetical protein LTR48_003218 [Friedmanniomyces endolithicus]KAK1807805.1 hypothetical protein LTR12_017836 [Friedmanniomyces endolithicus]KAK5145311.1 hypothetical protein LTR32_002916 [Rachicladosporium monterosium]
MLALATNTKSMKGSTVFRSWKDYLASKLHPQLPLSPRESNRLLTALTGSFRRHLDEVHPTTAPDSKPKLGSVSVLTTSPHAIHSSAISADKHLASVLTNPLLNKRRPDVSTPDENLANAKAELLMNPAKIPVEVLEEYNAKGAATVPIAQLCLQKFEDSLVGLSIDKQREVVAEAEPGRRTLLWLWRSGLYQTETFRQSGSFMHLLTFALMREGLDKYLWEWLCLDMGESRVKMMRRSAWWKGYILRTMAFTKLRPAYGQKASIDDALEVFFYASEVRDQSISAGTHMRWLPIHPISKVLIRVLTRRRHLYGAVETKNYERFQRRSNVYYPAVSKEGSVAFDDALLHLHHPEQPSGRDMLKLLRQVFGSEFSDEEKRARYPFVDPGGVKWTNRRLHITLVGVLHTLRFQRYDAEAAWLRGVIARTLPELDCNTDEELRKLASETAWDKSPVAAQTPKQEGNFSEPASVPCPEFT